MCFNRDFNFNRERERTGREINKEILLNNYEDMYISICVL